MELTFLILQCMLKVRSYFLTKSRYVNVMNELDTDIRITRSLIAEMVDAQGTLNNQEPL